MVYWKIAWNYLAGKLDQKSTWLAIGAAIPTAAGLKYPWSLLSILMVVFGVLCPDIPSVPNANK